MFAGAGPSCVHKHTIRMAENAAKWLQIHARDAVDALTPGTHPANGEIVTCIEQGH